MATYSVVFFCDEFSEVHELGISISLDDGPAKKESIRDFYDGKELNPSVATLIQNRTVCPNTGRLTQQQDNNQVYLMPIGD
jgi:hypothetical protein